MYTKHGIRSAEEFPGIADTYHGTVLVLGAGFNVYKEYDEARAKFPDAHIMIVNNSLIGLEWQIRSGEIKITHWVSLHPEHFWFGDIWMKDMAITHSNAEYPKTKIVWPLNGDGSSGLLATKIALLLGYDRIVLCGMPLDDARRFYDHPNTVYRMADPAIHQAWMDFINVVGAKEEEKICSMSGFSKDLFGGPL
jgi:hypothetical protein